MPFVGARAGVTIATPGHVGLVVGLVAFARVDVTNPRLVVGYQGQTEGARGVVLGAALSIGVSARHWE